jgi:hypothetical protein
LCEGELKRVQVDFFPSIFLLLRGRGVEGLGFTIYGMWAGLNVGPLAEVISSLSLLFLS